MMSNRYMYLLSKRMGRLLMMLTIACKSTGWNRSVTRILCNFNIPLRLKEMFYRVTISSVLLYDKEWWAIKRHRAHKMSLIEMHMFHWMFDNIKRDKVKNENILIEMGVTLIEEKMWEITWFGHVWGGLIGATVRLVNFINVGQVKRAKRQLEKNKDDPCARFGIILFLVDVT